MELVYKTSASVQCVCGNNIATNRSEVECLNCGKPYWRLGDSLHEKLADYHHIILYSKNWYKRSKNPISDLRKIIGKSCMLPMKYVSVHTVYRVMTDLLNTYVDEHGKRQFFEDIWHDWTKLGKPRKCITKTVMIKRVIGLLSIIRVKDDKGKTTLWLGEPDYSILPKREEK